MDYRMQTATTPVHYPLTGQYHQSSVTSQQVTQYPVQQISTATPSYQASMAGYQHGAATTMSNAGMSYGSGSVTRGTPAGPERVQSTRKISSTIVDEQFVGPPPKDWPVREVEVPGKTEEVVKVIPRKEIREVEKIVPIQQIVEVPRYVEVPKVVYVDKVVEVPQYVDVPVARKVTQWVDVPKEVITEVKVPKINYVEQIVKVPGEVIPRPKPYDVPQTVMVTQYTDRTKPVIVAQAVKPVIVEGAGVTEVDVYEYEPECVPVDVHVVKGVQAQVQVGGVIETAHKVVSVPSAQYNTILQQLNAHLDQNEKANLPYRSERGQVTFLGEYFYTAEVQRGVAVAGFDWSNLERKYVDYESKRVLPIDDPRAAGMASGAVGIGAANAMMSLNTRPVTSSGQGATAGYGTAGYNVSGMSVTAAGGVSGMGYQNAYSGATTREGASRSQIGPQAALEYGPSGTMLVPNSSLNQGAGYMQPTMRPALVA